MTYFSISIREISGFLWTETIYFSIKAEYFSIESILLQRGDGMKLVLQVALSISWRYVWNAAPTPLHCSKKPCGFSFCRRSSRHLEWKHCCEVYEGLVSCRFKCCRMWYSVCVGLSIANARRCDLKCQMFYVFILFLNVSGGSIVDFLHFFSFHIFLKIKALYNDNPHIYEPSTRENMHLCIQNLINSVLLYSFFILI